MKWCLCRRYERIFPILLHLEEPKVGQSYPNYYAALLASKFVKVVLAGTGGDELLEGIHMLLSRSKSQKF